MMMVPKCSPIHRSIACLSGKAVTQASAPPASSIWAGGRASDGAPVRSFAYSVSKNAW